MEFHFFLEYVCGKSFPLGKRLEDLPLGLEWLVEISIVILQVNRSTALNQDYMKNCS